MKLSQLEQIIEVANTGTISQAATNLFVSQPNLSLSIKRAEDELGTRLFFRSSSGMSLTASGVEFVDRAKEILQQLDALSEVCRSDKALFPLELNVASTSYRVVDIEVAKLLKKYDQNYVKVNFLDAAGVKLLDCVAENRAELGFCTVYSFAKQIMMRQISMRKLEYHFIHDLKIGIYVGANNPRFSDADVVVDFEKIKDTPVIRIANREFNSHPLHEHLYVEHGISLTPKREIIVSNFGMCRNMLNLEDGYTIGAFVDAPYGEEGFYSDVRFIPFPPDTLRAEFGCVQRENSLRSPLANELLKNVKRRFL